MTVITMTREMGTLGKDVAAGVAERLGLEVVHHEVVERDVASAMRLEESDVHRFLEGEPSLLQRWRIGSDRIARCTAAEILALAAEGDTLIRGWGASALLRRVPHVLRVRVCAPMAFRVRVMQERLGLADAASARREIERNDAAHSRSLQAMRAGDWREPLNYDLVINTERVPIDDCVAQVCALARSAAFAESERSRRVLAELMVETRVRNALAEMSERDVAARNIDLSVEDGEVTVSGLVHGTRAVEKICQAVEAVEGVRAVRNRLFTPPYRS